jgi:hypothetical protein
LSASRRLNPAEERLQGLVVSIRLFDHREVGTVLEDDALVHRVGCQNSVSGPELGVYAAGWYSLIRPPSTVRRVIRVTGR